MLHTNRYQNLSGLQHLLFSLASLRFGWILGDLGWARLDLAPGCRVVTGPLEVPHSQLSSYGDMLFSQWLTEGGRRGQDKLLSTLKASVSIKSVNMYQSKFKV